MKLFVCEDHDFHWPVGNGSVILAENEDEARALLDAELRRGGLKGYDEYPYTLEEIDMSQAQIVFHLNGDY